MEPDKKTVEPDNTAVRTALWRALHVQVDPHSHISLTMKSGLNLWLPMTDGSNAPTWIRILQGVSGYLWGLVPVLWKI